MIFPIPVFWRLRIPSSKRLSLIGVLVLGIFTTICSIMRFTEIRRIQFGDGDSTMFIFWSLIEFNVGVGHLPIAKAIVTYRLSPEHGIITPANCTFLGTEIEGTLLQALNQ